MKEQPIQSNELPSKEEVMAHFSTPDGYFDTLASNIMQKVCEEQAHSTALEAETPQIPRWKVYLKPLAYMAASFVLMISMFRLFDYIVSSPSDDALMAEDQQYVEYFYEECKTLLLEDTFSESRYVHNSIYGDGSGKASDTEKEVLSTITEIL